MSGGVDSSAAAVLMLEQGYECAGITFRLFNRGTDSPDINDAKAVAAHLGMAHHVVDLSKEFDAQVIRPFIETYERGATPNPCVICNRFIKFNLLLLRERQFDFDCLATGHYARVEYDSASGRFLLRKSFDSKKDQSYVLYGLSQQQLGQARFPLGELSKTQAREIAASKNLPVSSKEESQDICFVPDGDYGSFIEAYTGKNYPPGGIIDLEGNPLGRHRGIIRYTIGQRRGLGVAANTPLYVAAKSAVDNTVTLGPDSSLYSKSLNASGINLIACARIDKPQRAITPGQAAVMYDGDTVIGGGTIM
jgi:tRNA-specific 2-thiouridylase